MTASGTVPYTRAALGAGGGSRRSAILAAGWLALAGLLAGPATAWLPQSVVAGMILVIALAVVDRALRSHGSVWSTATGGPAGVLM